MTSSKKGHPTYYDTGEIVDTGTRAIVACPECGAGRYWLRVTSTGRSLRCTRCEHQAGAKAFGATITAGEAVSLRKRGKAA